MFSFYFCNRSTLWKTWKNTKLFIDLALPKGSQNLTFANGVFAPFGDILRASICTSLLTPFGSLLVAFGSLLVPFWFPFGVLWLPFGTPRFTFGDLWHHFGAVPLAFGTLWAQICVFVVTFFTFPMFCISAWILGNRRKHKGNNIFRTSRKYPIMWSGQISLHFIFRNDTFLLRDINCMIAGYNDNRDTSSWAKSTREATNKNRNNR